MDEDGNIESSSYRSIAKDRNDKVYAVVDEYLVEYLVIEEVDDKSSGDDKPELSDEIEVIDVNIGAPTTIEFYVESGKATSLTDRDIRAILTDAGCTSIKKDGTTGWSFVYDDMEYTGVKVKEEQVAAINVVVEGLPETVTASADVKYAFAGDTVTVTIKNTSVIGSNKTVTGYTNYGEAGQSTVGSAATATTNGSATITATWTMVGTKDVTLVVS